MKISQILEAQYKTDTKRAKRPTLTIGKIVRRAADAAGWEIHEQRNDKRTNDHRMCWWSHYRSPNDKQRKDIKDQIERDMVRGRLPGEVRWRRAEGGMGGYLKLEVIGVPFANPHKERKITMLRREKNKIQKKGPHRFGTPEQDRIYTIGSEISKLQEARYTSKADSRKLYYFEYYPHYLGTNLSEFETTVGKVDAFVRASKENDEVLDRIDDFGHQFAFYDVLQEWPSVRNELEKKGQWASGWEEGSHAISTTSSEHAKDVLRKFETDMKNGGEWESNWEPDEPEF